MTYQFLWTSEFAGADVLKSIAAFRTLEAPLQPTIHFSMSLVLVDNRLKNVQVSKEMVYGCLRG